MTRFCLRGFLFLLLILLLGQIQPALAVDPLPEEIAAQLADLRPSLSN